MASVSQATLAMIAESVAAGRIMSSTRKHVSHIGKQAIALPEGVLVAHSPPRKGTGMRSPALLTVTGPRGSTSMPVERYVKFDQTDPKLLHVSVVDPSAREQRERWGLTRSLIQNAVTGMTVGFTTPVHLVGVGFRAAVEPDPQGKHQGAVRLSMKLGYSHSVYMSVPQHIRVDCPLPTRIMISCDDKEKLGQFCADIRRWRKPEPYKGKGVFVGNEVVRIKSAKKK
ncbi:50s ribosomal protein [Auriculariales sp. MPI-PUGE-AT-0066]|nr:50s ribosomal protein [Auriculariales sp. MPI-PUGE-AT-0066]